MQYLIAIMVQTVAYFVLAVWAYVEYGFFWTKLGAFCLYFFYIYLAFEGYLRYPKYARFFDAALWLGGMSGALTAVFVAVLT